jgi:hypothetical protein
LGFFFPTCQKECLFLSKTDSYTFLPDAFGPAAFWAGDFWPVAFWAGAFWTGAFLPPAVAFFAGPLALAAVVAAIAALTVSAVSGEEFRRAAL